MTSIAAQIDFNMTFSMTSSKGGSHLHCVQICASPVGDGRELDFVIPVGAPKLYQ
jgi:hypothetical protein